MRGHSANMQSINKQRTPVMHDVQLPGYTVERTPPKSDIEILREFAAWAIREGCWNGIELDGGDIQEKAHDLGLLAEHEVTRDEVGRFGECEEGDTAYIFAGPLAPDKWQI